MVGHIVRYAKNHWLNEYHLIRNLDNYYVMKISITRLCVQILPYYKLSSLILGFPKAYFSLFILLYAFKRLVLNFTLELKSK